MKKVIFTTIQYNLEAIKMFELMVKSFFTFNKGFDFKVYCLDNSKDKFDDYFNKLNFENLEFINFKDGTKWNNYLNHIKNDELTELEKKNVFVSDPNLYVFNTNVCISKLEIIDLLLEKYDIVIASDIDIVFVKPIKNSLSAFLNSGKFLGAINESNKCKMSFSACFMYFNKDAKDRIFNLMDRSLYLLKNEDIREIPSFNKVGQNQEKYCFAFFEQDLLDYFINDYFRLNNFLISLSYKTDDFIKIFKNTDFELIHFVGPVLKPFYKFKNLKKLVNYDNYIVPLRYFYSNLFKVFGVDVDFNIKRDKFTRVTIAINLFYASLVQNIKKRILSFKT